MDSKIKIALVLSGQTNFGLFCYPYIYDNFINIPFNVDVFIHTWQNNLCTKLYNPKKILIEKQDDKLINEILFDFHLEESVIKDAKIPNFLLMHYSLSKSFSQVPEDYDIIIRCRFDFFAKKTDWLFVLDDLMSNKYDIFVPDIFENWNGLQDRFAIGNYSSMKIYCNTFKKIKYLANKYNYLHPERILKFNLEENKIRVYQKNLFFHSIIKKVRFINQNFEEFDL